MNNIIDLAELKALAKKRQVEGGKNKLTKKIGEANRHENEALVQFAKANNTTVYHIKKTDELITKRPDLADKVFNGELSFKEAYKLLGNTKKTEIEKHKGFKFKNAFLEIVNELSSKTFKNNAELLAELKKIDNVCLHVQNEYALITVFIDYARIELRRSKTPIMESLNDVLKAVNTGTTTKEYLKLTLQAIDNIQNGK